MSFRKLVFATMIFACAAFGSQQAEQREQQTQQDQQTQKPTLGPPTEPSLGGPRTSTTTDRQKLTRIQSIYVERIDNMLSDRLVEGLSKIGRFRVVASRKEADAVLRGTCFDSRRLKSVHSEVFLADRNGGSIWQDIVRLPFNPPLLQKAVDTTATTILEHLRESVREAERAP